MRNSASIEEFRFCGQESDSRDGETRLRTRLLNKVGCRLEHVMTWRDSDECFVVTTEFFNGSTAPVILEMLSSFSIGGITPFDAANALRRLVVHRFRSAWSTEGRHEATPLELLQLERSWNASPMFSERFGQVGSMPVRRWLPFLALEDTSAGVLWDAQLAWGGSWQMEIFRQNDDVCLSGGLADREFGHWMKTVAPGETFMTPSAILTCVAGGLDELCDRLTRYKRLAANAQPAIEHDMQIVYNEWCTTFGHPEHERVLSLADRLKETSCRYFVIGAGWYKTDSTDWSQSHGDWVPNKNLFPKGLAATAAIRERGLIPGLWFEMETVGPLSASFQKTDLLLCRDGIPITAGNRRFWYLNQPEVIAFLSERVIGLLEECGFGYLKVDYNESLGIGCDHPDSLGEGLRLQICGVYRFFDHIRERLPG